MPKMHKRTADPFDRIASALERIAAALEPQPASPRPPPQGPSNEVVSESGKRRAKEVKVLNVPQEED